MVACESSTPFGVPVVPDVYISIAGIARHKIVFRIFTVSHPCSNYNESWTWKSW